MRTTLVCAVALLAGCKAHHFALPAQPSVVKSTTLQYPSGLRVLFEQHPGSGRVAFAALVGAGSSSDALGREGTAHFVEHLAYRSRPAGRLSLWDELDFAGVASADSSTANAFTMVDSTVFSGITPKDRAASVLPLIASLVVQPLLGVDERVVELERSVVRNEHLQTDAHGGGDIQAAVARALFGSNLPGTRAISGSTASIAAITRADLEQFVTAHYRPEATTLVIVGDLEPGKIDAMVRASFPPGWLNPGPQGPVAPVNLDRRPMELNEPALAPNDPPVVEAALDRRLIIYSWVVPGSTEPGGSAIPLVANSLRESFWNVGRKLGVERVSARVVEGPVRSMLTLTARLEPDANLAAVRTAFRKHDNFGGVSFRDANEVALVQLYEEQNLQRHAESRALTIFATGSTKAPKLLLDETGKTALRYLYQSMLRWSRAREVHVTPLVKTNVALDEPPAKLDEAPRRVVVEPEMVKSVALPPPLPEVKRFTLENGLQVVLSRRTPVPLVSVTLGLPAGSRHTTRVVGELIGPLLHWDRKWVSMNGVARPFVDVRPDATVLSLNDAAWKLPVLLDVFGHNLRPDVRWRTMLAAEDVIQDVLEQLEKWAEEQLAKGELAAPRRTPLIRQLMAPGSTFMNLRLSEAKTLSHSDFADFIELAFRPNGAVLVVDGDLDLVSTEKIVRELFSDWSPSKAQYPSLRELGQLPPRQQKPTVIEAQEALVTKVRLACRLPPQQTIEQRGGAALLSRSLELSFEDDLRIARGLTYGVSSDVTDFRSEDNLLWLTATLDPRGKQAALERFVQRLDELDGAVWDEQLVDVARWRVAKTFMGSVATSPSIADLLAAQMAAGSSFEDTLALAAQQSSTALKYVDEAWATCSETLAIEVEGERSSIEAVFKRRAKK